MNLREFEERLRRLPGVEAARVIIDGDSVTEVHIVSSLDKAPKQVVRDVQTLAQAAYSLALDRRVVSVVQLPESALSEGDRPVVVDVLELIDGAHTKVSVTLAWQGESLVGMVEGAAGEASRHRLIAEATVAALRQALQQDTAFGVTSIDLVILGGRRIAVAQVVIVSDGNERLMVGSALVNGDPGRAIVRAVLDALNRHIPELRR
ncbi:MAG: hypothetical protein H0T94_10150 [Acidimicrobiia bacterium]|nr:hypothetical protein [Acidimicrobiia bacterium]